MPSPQRIPTLQNSPVTGWRHSADRASLGRYCLLTGNLTGIFATKRPFSETIGRRCCANSVRYAQIPYAEEQRISGSEHSICSVASANCMSRAATYSDLIVLDQVGTAPFTLVLSWLQCGASFDCRRAVTTVAPENLTHRTGRVAIGLQNLQEA